MEIIRSEDLENGWPMQSFQEAYQNVAGEKILKCFAITKGDESGDPDRTSVIFVRLFVDNGERAKKDQKYIVGLRFYSFGDMATVDIISLDKPNHRDIVKEHAEKMNWLLPGLTERDAFQQSYSMPILAVGAHLRVSAEGSITPFDSSCDFGNNLLGLDASEVVRQIAFLCELNSKEDKKGNDFLEGLLAFMLQNKKRPDFYESFVEHYAASKPTGQNYGGLLTMKMLDRSLEEGSDNFLKLLVEEVTDGFAKRCLLIGAAQIMKE